MVAPAESKTIKRSIIAVLVVSLLGFFIYAFSPDPVPVDMAGVFQGDMQVTVKDEGYTRIEDVYVVSAPVAGHLLRIDQQVGDAVTAGETLLAKLLPSDPVVLDSRSRRQYSAPKPCDRLHCLSPNESEGARHIPYVAEPLMPAQLWPP